MPFITEELWSEFAPAGKGALISEQWPSYEGVGDAAASAEMDGVVRLIAAVRSIRAEMNVPPGAEIPLYLKNADAATSDAASRHETLIKRLARLSSLGPLAGEVPKGAVQEVLDTVTLVLPLAEVIDIAKERVRLEKEAQKQQGEIKKIDAKLGNESFVAKAPPAVVEEQKIRREEAVVAESKIREALARLS